MRWLIYGAYGYTGRLVAELAVARGEQPLLAGRDPARLQPLARRLGLEHRAFDLEDPDALVAALTDVDAVAHCAGPFSHTASAMVDACVASRSHYVDVTGEMAVLEQVLGRDAEAGSAGVALLPGSGFDVVPSDCLAAMLDGALPSATELELAFKMEGGVSPGTAKSALEAVGAAGLGRVDGVVTDVAKARRRRRVAFADGEADVTAVSWGDIATAYHSTGIGTITTYTVLPPLVGLVASVAALVGARAAAAPSVQGLMQSVAGHVRGPSRRARSRSLGQLWGRVADGAGNEVTGTMTTPNGYDLTADSVVRIMGRLAEGRVPPGAHTPSQAHGAGFATELDGVVVSPLVHGPGAERGTGSGSGSG